MTNKWQNIWNNRQINNQSNSILEFLMITNGYDNKFSTISESDWINYLVTQGKNLKVNPEDSIFEVGCGAGALLYPFYQQGNKIAGIDYSESLVKLAKETMPEANITVNEAIDFPQDHQFDVVVSNGVFLYFPNYEYAATVVKNMVEIADKSIGIFDVPDLAKKEYALAKRKSLLTENEYQEKYQGLDHLYYAKDWFQEVLREETVKITIEDQNISNYGNNDYRFNVLIHK